MKMNIKLPQFYQTIIAPQLTPHQWLRLKLLIALISIHRWVRLEDLANRLPQPVQFESRRRGIQRLLDLPVLTFETLWFPIFELWLTQAFSPQDVVYIAIDRTRWCQVNLLVVSLIYRQRTLPIYITSLAKKGNSNFLEQQQVLSKVLPLFNNYTVVVLGDREFCGIPLAQWLQGRPHTYFSLRLKKNTHIEGEIEDKRGYSLGNNSLKKPKNFCKSAPKIESIISGDTRL